TLVGTTRTVNADWFKNAGPSTSQQTAMKAARQDGKGDLNDYYVGYVGSIAVIDTNSLFALFTKSSAFISISLAKSPSSSFPSS
ncbi:hypothetical protein DFH09DRAFT_936448, partial [Mycena vulgaris]